MIICDFQTLSIFEIPVVLIFRIGKIQSAFECMRRAHVRGNFAQSLSNKSIEKSCTQQKCATLFSLRFLLLLGLMNEFFHTYM